MIAESVMRFRAKEMIPISTVDCSNGNLRLEWSPLFWP